MNIRILVLILCAFPVLGSAQDRTSVSGPVSGFFFDQTSRALRPVVGVPGAAYLGSAALDGVDAASVCPDGSAALAVREGRLYLITGLNAVQSAAAVEGSIENIDRMVWAADGASAAVYASKSGLAQVLRNLPKAPETGEAIDLSALPGAVTALAVAGKAVLAGVAAESAGGIYLAAPGATAKLLAPAARPSGIAVDGDSLYFADQERGQVWEVRKFATDATPLLFADALASPVGLQLSGTRLFVANAGDSTLEVFDTAARASSGRLQLDAAPAMLGSFGSRSVWLLNASAGDENPIYVLSGGDNPAVYFVPAGREE
jgi:hypothetical protein